MDDYKSQFVDYIPITAFVSLALPTIFNVLNKDYIDKMKLYKLYAKLKKEGCNKFCIIGIGGLENDCDCLLKVNGRWEIFYSERGQRSQSVFSTFRIDEAISFYFNHVIKTEHMHIVVSTRSSDLLYKFKSEIEKLGIKIIQNDISNFSEAGDRVYRLFVIKKDIFIVKKKMKFLPYFDEDLKSNKLEVPIIKNIF